jgi:hypothetical protein
LPVKLEEIIRNALEKDRESRYQTATEMFAELKSALNSIQAMPAQASLEGSPVPGDASLSDGRAAPSRFALRAGTLIGAVLLLFGAISLLNEWRTSRGKKTIVPGVTLIWMDGIRTAELSVRSERSWPSSFNIKRGRSCKQIPVRHECPLNVEGELNEIQFWPDTKI